jgi:hypothetical protein
MSFKPTSISEGASQNLENASEFFGRPGGTAGSQKECESDMDDDYVFVPKEWDFSQGSTVKASQTVESDGKPPHERLEAGAYLRKVSDVLRQIANHHPWSPTERDAWIAKKTHIEGVLERATDQLPELKALRIRTKYDPEGGEESGLYDDVQKFLKAYRQELRLKHRQLRSKK